MFADMIGVGIIDIFRRRCHVEVQAWQLLKWKQRVRGRPFDFWGGGGVGDLVWSWNFFSTPWLTMKFFFRVHTLSPAHIYSSQKENTVIPEVTSEVNSSHSPLFLGREYGNVQNYKLWKFVENWTKIATTITFSQWWSGEKGNLY